MRTGSLETLEQMKGETLGHPVDRFEHSLQTATRAHRDGADEEMIVCALLHDIGDSLAPYNHGPLAAEVLRPYVSEQNAWLVRHHEIFQGYFFFHHIGRDRHERERFRGHPAFQITADFCEKWDQAAFDPNYDTMPLSAFEADGPAAVRARAAVRQPAVRRRMKIAVMGTGGVGGFFGPSWPTPGTP